ncbi:MAG: sigma 54-interacting transcriptional regulator [Planctomycetota bacterium]
MLLVEDDEDWAFVILEQLESDPLDQEELPVRRARTLREALALLEGVQVVLLDLSLPDSQGLDTFHAVRAAAPDLPIVVHSGLDGEELACQAVREGAQDYLVKGSTDGATLRRALRYAVARSRHAAPEGAQRGQERFWWLVEEAEHPKLVLDRAWKVLFANRAARRLIGEPSPLGEPAAVGEGCATLDLGARGAYLLAPTDTLWDGELAYLATVEPRPREPRAPRPQLSRFDGLRSASPAMRELFEFCERVAPTDASVLLLGETGTGKELLARALHNRSGRRGRFVAVNCGAIPLELVESELFGHERGAFTGANAARPGLFRAADGGTLMLDEVGDLPPQAQLSLLRALQERVVRPLGSPGEVAVDVRVIAATSVPLPEAVAAGRFRADLLYRLDVIRVEVLPLRERREDILHLFRYFLAELGARYGLEAPEVGAEFLEGMLEFRWPGNVRQLENFAERMLLTGPGSCVTRRDFQDLLRPAELTRRAAAPAEPEPGPPPVDLGLDLPGFLADQERRYLLALLEACGGRKAEAARRAGVNRRTFYRRLARLGLPARRPGSGLDGEG